MSALRYASLGEYIDFLRVYFASGGSASHYYDYPFAQHKGGASLTRERTP